jgi:hypothetical protein
MQKLAVSLILLLSTGCTASAAEQDDVIADEQSLGRLGGEIDPCIASVEPSQAMDDGISYRFDRCVRSVIVTDVRSEHTNAVTVLIEPDASPSGSRTTYRIMGDYRPVGDSPIDIVTDPCAFAGRAAPFCVTLAEGTRENGGQIWHTIPTTSATDPFNIRVFVRNQAVGTGAILGATASFFSEYNDHGGQ